MDEHQTQKQHRVPQVYLRKFGYQKDGKWYISVINKINLKKKPLTYDEIPFEQIEIADFNCSINEFDYPFHTFKEKKHYETTSALIEGKYPIVLNSIKNQKQLTKSHEDILRHFTASLICRAKLHRDFFANILSDDKTVDKILEEITMFDIDDKPVSIKVAFDYLKKEKRLALVQGIITNHIVRVLRSFNSVILVDFNGLAWCTSDNPVYINYNENYSWVLPAEAEIYLPLSPEFCLFMFNPGSTTIKNSLRNLMVNRINTIDKSTFWMITNRLIENTMDTLIVPGI
jgi:hypothetical protein